MPSDHNKMGKYGKEDEEPPSIPLTVLGRTKVVIWNNQDIIDVLSSHASSAGQIVMVLSAKGYISFASLNSITSPGPAPFLALGGMQILYMYAIFNPTNTMSEDQLELEDSVLGHSRITYTSMALVKLMGLPEDRYTAQTLRASGDVELEIALIGGIGLEIHMNRLKKESELTSRLEAGERAEDDPQQRRND